MPIERKALCLKFIEILFNEKIVSLSIPSTLSVYIAKYTTWKSLLLYRVFFATTKTFQKNSKKKKEMITSTF